MLGQRAVEITQIHQLTLLLPYAQTVLGTAQRALWALEAATATHAAALAANTLLPTQPFTELIHTQLCADHALAGRWDMAHRHAQLVSAARKTDALYVGQTRWVEVEALLRTGEVEAAHANVASFEHFVDGADESPRFQLAQFRIKAVLAMAGHHLAIAVHHLTAALQLAERMGVAGEQWPVLALLGWLHHQQGDDAQAEQLRSQALSVVQELANTIRDPVAATAFIMAATRHIQQPTSPWWSGQAYALLT
jgi:hypothetical protein